MVRGGSIKNGVTVAQYFYDGDGGRMRKINYASGQTGNNTCFLAGTKILMADGSQKSIEDIKQGDVVASFDEKKLTRTSGKVTAMFDGERTKEYLLVNGNLKVTPNHRFYSKGEWIEIGKLKEGDLLLDDNSKEVAIKKIEKITSQNSIQVYNLEVEGEHNYYVIPGGPGIIPTTSNDNGKVGANGLLVHNKLSYNPPVVSGVPVTSGVMTNYVGSLAEETKGTWVNSVFLGSTKITSVSSNQVRFYFQDHLGSANVVTNFAGSSIELMEYKPYGDFARHEKYGGNENVAWYYFTGKPLDEETGLMFYGARYYSPLLGRFITPDTIVQSPGNPQTLNRYSYCNNNPVNLIDPTGHKWSWKKFWNAFAGAVVGAIITVATGGLGAPMAFALGGMTGGAVTGGLEGGWRGALMSGLMGGILGGGVGWGISEWGAGFGYAALAAGGGYAAATGNLDSFIGGLSGGIVGTGIGSYHKDGISMQTPDGQSDPNALTDWDVLGIGTTDAKAAAFANKNNSAVFYTRSRGYLSDFVRAGMQKIFGNSLASRQFANYLRGANGINVAAHSEGTLTLAGAIKCLSIDGVKLPETQFSFNGPVIMQSTAYNLANMVGAPQPKYSLNFGDPIGIFTTLNPIEASLHGIMGLSTLATYHSTNRYPNMNTRQ